MWCFWKILSCVMFQAVLQGCFQMLSGSISFSPINRGQWIFEEGENVTLNCTIIPYSNRNHQNWKFNSTNIISRCDFSSCIVSNNNNGTFTFHQNTTIGEFFWFIYPMPLEYNNAQFECSDGSDYLKYDATVLKRTTPNQSGGQPSICDLRCLGILAVIALIIIIIIIIVAKWYHSNKGPQIQLSGQAKGTCRINLWWRSDNIPNNSTFHVFQKNGNDDVNPQFKDIYSTSDITNTSYTVPSLQPKTKYTFIIEVMDANNKTITKSNVEEITTLGNLILHGKARSMSEIDLFWESEHTLFYSSFVVFRKLLAIENVDAADVGDYDDSEKDTIPTNLKKREIESKTHYVSYLQAGTRYAFFIKVKDKEGQIVTQSNQIGIKTTGIKLQLDGHAKSVYAIELSWTHDRIPNKSKYTVFRKQLEIGNADDNYQAGNTRSKNDRKKDARFIPTNLSQQEIEKNTSAVSSLHPGTKYAFYIEVYDAFDAVITKSNEKVIETQGYLKLHGEAKSIHEIDLFWKSEHIPDYSSFVVFRKRLTIKNEDTDADVDAYDDSEKDNIPTILKKGEIELKTHHVSSLQAGTRYAFFIKVKNADDQIVAKSNKIVKQTKDK